MTQEEKAKAYDRALERAKIWKDKSGMPKDKQGILDDIFPELAESEDELVWLTKYIEEEAYSLSMDIRDNEDRIKLKNLQKSLAWLEKQRGKDKLIQELGEYKVKYTQEVLGQYLEKQGEKMKAKSEVIKDYIGEENVWNNACDFRPKHLQRCICYDKYMKGVYCYVYDDISKYWCTQTTEEHDPDGDNHVCDYADYRVTVWMPLPDTSFYPSKSWLEKQGEGNN